MAKQPQGEDAPRPPKFEESLDALEGVVKQLESADVPLEDALVLFEKGMQLSETCRQQLAEAELRVEMLVKKASGVAAEPFDPEAG